MTCDHKPLRQTIQHRLCDRLFGGKLIQNNLRGEFVEELVALALEPHWHLCSGDWAGWDFENEAGLRIQIKQSAAKQSWRGKPYAGAFDIRPSKGYWVDGINWLELPGRASDLFVFAWHPTVDDSCDHTDPGQWRFYVVPEWKLPADQKSISRTVVGQLSTDASLADLEAAIAKAAETIATDKYKVQAMTAYLDSKAKK